MPIMQWDDLRIFLAVARGGGFVAAGRRLGLDHTTVARRLTALEAATGAVLMNRSPRGSTLTDAGQSLLERAERMEAEAIAAAEQLGAADHRLSGVVRLATPEAFGSWLVAPAVHRLHARHPGIQLELAPEARTVNLSKREADLAITLSPPPRGRLFAKKLADYHLGLYASRAYVERAAPITGVEDLRDHPLVWYIDDLIDDPELRFLDQVTPGLRPEFRSSSIVAQQAAVAAGFGIGILHRFAAEQDDRLVRLLADRINLKRSYWVVLHADQRSLPRIREVADFLAEVVKHNRDWL